MSADPVRAIADAVLYEGYILWPYRRSALKNQQRWTFGGVHPPAWARLHPDDPAHMRTECLIEGDEVEVDVDVRFLHVVARDVLSAGEPVDELTVAGERHVAWDEAREREVSLAGLRAGAEAEAAVAVRAGAEEEELVAADGAVAGAVRRRWGRLDGSVRAALEPLGDGLLRVEVEIANATAWEGENRADAMRATFCSAHTVLRARGGAFVSLTDPPAELRVAAAACRNVRTWPVLVGAPGSRDTVLSSPIILEDHPRIAPESPGDLFDGGEVDQLLTLSILAMTEEERRDMRDADPRAREILERTEALTDEELMRLGGAIRDFQVRGR
jgi:hypothetical protein